MFILLSIKCPKIECAVPLLFFENEREAMTGSLMILRFPPCRFRKVQVLMRKLRGREQWHLRRGFRLTSTAVNYGQRWSSWWRLFLPLSCREQAEPSGNRQSADHFKPQYNSLSTSSSSPSGSKGKICCDLTKTSCKCEIPPPLHFLLFLLSVFVYILQMPNPFSRNSIVFLFDIWLSVISIYILPFLCSTCGRLCLFFSFSRGTLDFNSA